MFRRKREVVWSHPASNKVLVGYVDWRGHLKVGLEVFDFLLSDFGWRGDVH